MLKELVTIRFIVSRSCFDSQSMLGSLCRSFQRSVRLSTTPGTYRSSSTTSSLLDQFRDTVPREKRMSERVGRPWSVKELRRKSFQDLHKLWFVLYKERNMLLTEKQLSRRKGVIFPQPDRMKKVQKSMGAIRHVLGERKRDKLASLALASSYDDDANVAP